MTDTRTFAPASGNYGAILAQYIVFTKAYSPQNSVDQNKIIQYVYNTTIGLHL